MESNNYNLRENPMPTPKNTRPTHRKQYMNIDEGKQSEKPNTTPDLPDTESDDDLNTLNTEMNTESPDNIIINYTNTASNSNTMPNMDSTTQIMMMLQRMSDKLESKLQETNERITESCHQLKKELTETLHTEITHVRQEMHTMRQETNIKFLTIEAKLQDTVTQKQLSDIISRVSLESQQFTKAYTNEKLEEVSIKISDEIKNTKYYVTNKYQEVDCTLNNHEVILNNHDTSIKESDIQIIKLKQEVNKIQNDIQQGNGVNNNLIGLPEIILQSASNPIFDNLPKFDSKNRNPKEFIKKLNEYYNHLKKIRGPRSDVSYLELVEQCLEGNSATWWQVIKDSIKSADDFECKFLKQYWSAETQREIKRRIENEKYRPDGKMSRTEYFLDKVMVLRNITPPLQEEDIVQIVSESFNEMIRDAMRVQNVTTVQHFLELLNREDISHKNARLINRNSNRSEFPTETRTSPRQATNPNNIRNETSYPRDNRILYNPHIQFRNNENNHNLHRNVPNGYTNNNRASTTVSRSADKPDARRTDYRRNQDSHYGANNRDTISHSNQFTEQSHRTYHPSQQQNRSVNHLRINSSSPRYYHNNHYPSEEQRRVLCDSEERGRNIPLSRSPAAVNTAHYQSSERPYAINLPVEQSADAIPSGSASHLN